MWLCLPLCVCASILSAVGLLSCRVLFCESLCRVQTLSLTAKLLRPFCHKLVVPWKRLDGVGGGEYVGPVL